MIFCKGGCSFIMKIHFLLVFGSVTISLADEDNAYIETAQKIRGYMDESVNPCDNFYQFACGAYVNNPTNPENCSPFFSPQTKVDIDFADMLSNIRPNNSRAFSSLKAYYDSCIDNDNIQRSMKREFISIMKALGGWPMLKESYNEESWDETDFVWTELLYRLRALGLPNDILMSFKIDAHPLNHSSNIIYLEPPKLLLANEFMGGKPGHPEVQDYLSLIEWMDVSHDKTEDIRKVLEFDKEVAECDRNSKSNVKFLKMNGLNGRAPNIHWRKYIVNSLGIHASLNLKDRFFLGKPDYFICLDDIIKNKPKRDLANYIFFYVVLKVGNLIGNYGATPEERKLFCSKRTAEDMDIAASALYVRNKGNPELKRKVTNLVAEIRDGVRSTIEKATWMIDQSKHDVLEKLSNTEAHIAYPDEYFDDQKIDEHYKDLPLIENSYLYNIMSVRTFDNLEKAKNLRKRLERTSWLKYDSATTLNTRYDQLSNVVEIPIVSLHDDMFKLGKHHNYFNFAAIGSRIAHEFGHAFDSGRLRYDEFGEERKWLADETVVKFQEKFNCLIDQYNNYYFEDSGLHVDGLQTLEENVADNIGFKAAYEAYKKWQKENGSDLLPQNWKYTAEQMFWIELGISWCEVRSPEDLENLIKEDEHGPAEFRVIGTLSNIPEFFEDFHCPRDTAKMYRDKMCELF